RSHLLLLRANRAAHRRKPELEVAQGPQDARVVERRQRQEAYATGLIVARGPLEHHRALDPHQLAAVGQLERERDRRARQVGVAGRPLWLDPRRALLLCQRQLDVPPPLLPPRPPHPPPPPPPPLPHS